MPKYSFVIPVYNSRQYLRECVVSVLNQTMPDFEILLIDDGSTDGSGELCDELAKNDIRIRVFHKENGGAASARNLGIEQAKGDCLLFVDGDDTIEKNCLEMLDPLVSKEGCLPVFGMFFDYWRNGQLIKSEMQSASFPGCYQISEISKELPKFFNDNVLSSACNKVFPAKLLRENVLRFPESMSIYEDLTFVMRCLPHFDSICVLDRGLYHYRNQAGKEHLDRRVADLDRLRTNLIPLSYAFHEFGSKTDQSEVNASVFADLYIMLLEMHLLSVKPSVAVMRRELPPYISEEGFRIAMQSGAKLDSGKEKLVERIEQGKYRTIWFSTTYRRTRGAFRRAVKKLLRR